MPDGSGLYVYSRVLKSTVDLTVLECAHLVPQLLADRCSQDFESLQVGTWRLQVGASGPHCSRGTAQVGLLKWDCSSGLVVLLEWTA